MKKVIIVGAGLAGAEAAWQAARRGAEGKRKVRRSGMVFLPVRFGAHGQNGDAVRVLEEEGPAVPVLFPFEAREDH